MHAGGCQETRCALQLICSCHTDIPIQSRSLPMSAAFQWHGCPAGQHCERKPSQQPLLSPHHPSKLQAARPEFLQPLKVVKRQRHCLSTSRTALQEETEVEQEPEEVYIHDVPPEGRLQVTEEEYKAIMANLPVVSQLSRSSLLVAELLWLSYAYTSQYKLLHFGAAARRYAANAETAVYSHWLRPPFWQRRCLTGELVGLIVGYQQRHLPVQFTSLLTAHWQQCSDRASETRLCWRGPVLCAGA